MRTSAGPLRYLRTQSLPMLETRGVLLFADLILRATTCVLMRYWKFDMVSFQVMTLCLDGALKNPANLINGVSLKASPIVYFTHSVMPCEWHAGRQRPLCRPPITVSDEHLVLSLTHPSRNLFGLCFYQDISTAPRQFLSSYQLQWSFGYFATSFTSSTYIRLLQVEKIHFYARPHMGTVMT